MKLLSAVKKEDGAATVIEAAVIYPIVFLCLFLILYIGLYVLQTITVSAYAQKTALLAAREVAFPGYLELVSESKYNTSAVEAEFIDTSSGEGEEKGKAPYEGNVAFNLDPKKVSVRAYRYWSSDPLDNTAKTKLKEILEDMVKNNSIFGSGDVHATVSCDNHVVTQYIMVTVEQEMLRWDFLSLIGVDAPKVKATATATVSDTDELVRTTDFVVDALETIAGKLGIDTKKVKNAIVKAKDRLGLN